MEIGVSLVVSLDGSRASDQPVPTIKAVSLDKQVVMVRSLSVKEAAVGLFRPAIDPGGSADFYANITMRSLQ